MTKIDTNYIRGRCDISTWLHDQFRIEIKELCDAYDKATKEIEYLIAVAREAEKMAKHYSTLPIQTRDGNHIRYTSIDMAANEFLSFLEKGE